jgi:putative transposase
VAEFIALQRAEFGVAHVVACRALGVSQAWFYKWRHGDSSPRRTRRRALAALVAALFAQHRGTYGAPRITADVQELGWRVSQNTIAAIMAEQGLKARARRRRRSTTRPGKGRWRAPDLVKRDFAAEGINQKWYGDGTEIPTGQGKLHLASVLDMGSRRIVGFALSEHHDAALAYGSLAMAVAVRGGQVGGVVLHTDGGSEYTAGSSARRVPAWASANPWAARDRPWTMRSSSPGTPPWSSSCVRVSSSRPRPLPASGSRTGWMSTTAPGDTLPSG